MCGIAGIISNGEIENENIINMIECISHRGPDGKGFYIDEYIALGNTRLSIIDLEYGNQPVENENGNIVIVFNGEIYNYRELVYRLECIGHNIKSHSDGAILPHMYEEYGDGMFEKLNGQFAIAIWDKEQKKLTLARDKMGEKPIYYYNKDNLFCFASEIKAIFKTGYVIPKISPRVLGHMFIFQTSIGNSSVFEDISSLPPGHFLSFKNGCVNLRSYWHFSYTGIVNRKDKDTSEYILEAEEITLNAVKKNIISDVPISTYLSGGLDSSLITAIASKLTKHTIDTFSISFSDDRYDESYYQELVVKHVGTNHHNILFNTDDIPNIIRSVVYHTEVPFFSPGAFGMYYLSQLVKRHKRKVVLDGQGADELFGGYSWFKDTKVIFNTEEENQIDKNFSVLFKDGSIKETYGYQLKRWLKKPLKLDLLSSNYLEQISYRNEEMLLKTIAPPDLLNQWTPLQRQQFLSIVINLPNYLLCTLGDRVAMASGVECYDRNLLLP